jgi:hypothetical protein
MHPGDQRERRLIQQLAHGAVAALGDAARIVDLTGLVSSRREPSAYFFSHGTSPWDHPAQAGYSNPAHEILTLESSNNFLENCQFRQFKPAHSSPCHRAIDAYNEAHRLA